MLAHIGHRGPDEAGYIRDPTCSLGNVRLSIVDLAHGHQPMRHPSGRYWITFNGEIYNYLELRDELRALGCHFADDSDTEVLLHAWATWGEGCLDRLNGAFAFAVYDSVEGTLSMARDRFGKRPLFYTRAGNRMLFASEMKAFLACEQVSFRPDIEDFATVLATWTPLPHQTCWEGIEALPLGSVLRLDRSGQQEIRQFARPEFHDNFCFSTIEEAVEAVRARVIEAVKVRLRTDVPVGLYLSGGLDSSILASIMADLGGDGGLSSFSITFGDSDLDESAYQTIVADRYGLRHNPIEITHDQICAAFPDAVYHAEVPVFRTAFVPMYLLSRRVQAAGIKTVLSGEGADEVFLGYDLFRETTLRKRWDSLDTETRKDYVARLNPFLAHFSNARQSGILGLYDQFSRERMPGLFSHEMRYQNGNFALRLLKDRQVAETGFAPIMAATSAAADFAGLSATEKAQWLEFNTLLPGYLLSTQGERMGLAHGVENRCPFLDPNVTNLMGAVNLKFDDGWDEKHLLKRAFPTLPPEVLTRHKHPYRAADSTSFVEARPEYMELVLSEQELDRSGLIDTRFAQRLMNKILTTPADRISVREHQAFVYLLSFQCIQQQFTQRDGAYVRQDKTVRDRLTVAVEIQEVA